MSRHSTVRSTDGTSIAYDSVGDGPVLILVGGAFSYRRYKTWVQLAELLAPRFRVISYDRRGRGDSGDAPVHAVEREIEDLDALVQAAGGSAHVFGMSSGGVLALRAAAAGVPVRRAVVYQPPFSVDASGHVPPPDFGPRLRELARSGRRGRPDPTGGRLPAAVQRRRERAPAAAGLRAASQRARTFRPARRYGELLHAGGDGCAPRVRRAAPRRAADLEEP